MIHCEDNVMQYKIVMHITFETVNVVDENPIEMG